jgi:hypothetical protein
MTLPRPATIDAIVPMLLLHASARVGSDLAQALTPTRRHIMR